MIDDLFIPDPPTGDNSNRIADTRFVNTAITNATAAAGTITNAMLANMASFSIKSNVTNAAAVPADNSVSLVIDNLIGSTQGALLYRNAATWVVLGPGTQSTFLQTQGAAANPQWASPVFTKSFISAGQTITTAGGLTLAHGLGVVPSLVQVTMVCQTAEQGYSTGDVIFQNPDTSSSTQGVSVRPDATNLNIRYSNVGGAAFSTLNKTSGAITSLTNGNWSAVFSAWA